MVEIFFVEEGNVGVAVMEKDGWPPPSSFLTIASPFDSLLATISTAALSADFASVAFDDDAVDAATADGGDGVGRCAAAVPPPPRRLPSDAFPTNELVGSVDASLTPFIFMQLIDVLDALLLE